jgi:hypothetical protein
MNSVNEEKVESMQDLKRGVARYGYQDGVVEISIGITYIFIGLMLFFYKIKLNRPLYGVIFVLACWGVLFAGGVWFVRKLKGKLVWGKTGYYKIRESYPELFWAFMGLSILAAVSAVFSGAFFSVGVAVFLFGACFFFGLISQFFQTGKIKRFLYVSFVPLFAAGICVLLELPLKQSLVAMFLATGCVFLVSGIVVYKKFREEYDG